MSDHNATGKLVTVIADVSAIGDDGLQWIEVLPTAEKKRNGSFYFSLDRDDLETLAASIIEKGDQAPLDYDHSYVERGDTRAAGWFTGQAEVRDTDNGARLYAEVKWTASAIEAIKAREYRFISAELTFSKKDAKTGLWTKAKEFLAATLTNRPFFTELKPVTAAVVWEESTGYVQRMNEINEALNGDVHPWRYWVMDVGDGKALVCEGDEYWVVPFTIGDDGEAIVGPSSDWTPAEQQYVSAAQVAAAKFKETLGGQPAPIEGEAMDPKILAALGLPEDADDETVLAAATAAKQKADQAAELEAERARLKTRRTPTNGGTVNNEELIAALGLNDDADEAEVLAAVRTAKAGAERLEQLETENDSMKGVVAQNRTLENRMKVLEAERRGEKIQRILTDGVRAGKVFPAEKQSLAKQFATNPDGLAEIIDARPDHAFSLTGAGHGDLDEGDDIISVKAEFASEEADGVDTDSARLHVRATQILREQGVRTPTEAQYEEALAAASLTVAR